MAPKEGFRCNGFIVVNDRFIRNVVLVLQYENVRFLIISNCEP